MYVAHFRLRKEPFSIAPDPRFLFMSEQHREALAHLLYGLGGSGGFVLLTGAIGAGKTTVCRCFLEQVPPRCRVAYVFNPRLTAIELLQTICQEFGLALPPAAAASVKAHVDALNAFLLEVHAGGGSAVLVIDEAQSLAPEVLEQLRLLTNLETAERKLLQIVLIGQPELREMLARPELEQLAQRIVARFHLGALDAAQTQAYVRHRVAMAGGDEPPFERDALARVHALTAGVPRRINLLADRALLGAYAQGQRRVDRATLERAAREVFGGLPPHRRAWVAGAGLLLAAGLGWWLWPQSAPPAPARDAGAARAASAPASAGARAVTAEGPAASTGAAASTSATASTGATSSTGATASTGAAAPTGAAALTGAAAPTGAAASTHAPALAPWSASAGPPGSARSSDPAAAAAAPLPAGDLDALLSAASPRLEPALAELAQAWQAKLDPTDPCGAAPAAGLACFRGRGGLAVLRPLDRPALLVLQRADGATVYARLLGMDAQGALLASGGQRLHLGLAALAAVWRGEFVTLWRPPPGWRASGEALGEAGRSWVRQRLAAAGFADEALPLRARVWAFQVAGGLEPDGRIGPLTLMRLARSAGAAADEPRLTAGS